MLAASAAILTPIVLTLRYLTLCYVKPFRTCRKCDGKRRIPNRIGKGSHDCRRCDATGLRLRWGRHVLNYARRLHRDGTR
ncbi:hypothetical protein E1267_02950 [Nonomuraea longispora]|uniref:Uncharacterized protein n=1 Tax=Nonomuraea longispora TaxID=1848320 RepID=A0A4R4NN96_9ACTN|nr:hypothetical protein [Nonomuraea longispora]TDC10715.1 hypothetical protein E1267_02950 [Nonomuraea longispora]